VFDPAVVRWGSGRGSGLAEFPVIPVAVVVVLVLGQHRCGVPLVDDQRVVE
jgi:hypothetical protein